MPAILPAQNAMEALHRIALLALQGECLECLGLAKFAIQVALRMNITVRKYILNFRQHE